MKNGLNILIKISDNWTAYFLLKLVLVNLPILYYIDIEIAL
jgi:hypothetical protein